MAFLNRLLNACRRSTSSASTRPNWPVTTISPPSCCTSCLRSSAARCDQGGEIVCRERQLRRPREIQKVRDHLTERLGLLPDAFDVRLVLRWQRRRIDQLAVAVDRRQPVAELVRDSRGQLTETRQRFLQPELLFELRSTAVRSENRQMTPPRCAVALAEPRRGDTDMCDVVRLRHFERTSHDRLRPSSDTR